VFGESRDRLRVLSLLRNRLLTRGFCQILVDLMECRGNFICMLILTVGSKLCTFCRLHLRTLRNHCCAAHATPPEHDLGLRYFGLFNNICQWLCKSGHSQTSFASHTFNTEYFFTLIYMHISAYVYQDSAS
jgi:hypothetical protein